MREAVGSFAKHSSNRHVQPFLSISIYQFKVIRHVLRRMFGVRNSERTPGPARNRSSSLFDLDIVMRCRSFCVNDAGSSLPFTRAKVSRMSLASPKRPFANNHRGDSGKNLKWSPVLRAFTIFVACAPEEEIMSRTLDNVFSRFPSWLWFVIINRLHCPTNFRNKMPF